MARPKGICSICGKGGKLSFEHVPPRSAFNQPGTELSNVGELMKAGMDWAKLKTIPQPEGTGYVTICPSCNNYSGDHYVPEFGRWVRTGMNMLQMLPWAEFDANEHEQGATFELKKTNPLPLIKEIVAMLLALNGEANPAFRTDNEELVEFVLDKNRVGLSSRYHVYICLFAGPVCRFAPVSIMQAGSRTVVVTAIDFPPFSYSLVIGDPADFLSITDITSFADCGPNVEKDFTGTFLCAFGHTALPLDYRSTARIRKDEVDGVKTEIVPTSVVRSDGSFLPRETPES